MAQDAIALLEADHQRVEGLFREFKSAGSDPAVKLPLAQVICMELTLHAMVEEEIFYPAYRDAVRSKSDKQLFYEAKVEHHVVDLVLPEVNDDDKGGEEFAAKAKVLKELVEHHADEEEKEMFPKARKVLSRAELLELGERLQQRKQELM